MLPSGRGRIERAARPDRSLRTEGRSTRSRALVLAVAVGILASGMVFGLVGRDTVAVPQPVAGGAVQTAVTPARTSGHAGSSADLASGNGSTNGTNGTNPCNGTTSTNSTSGGNASQIWTNLSCDGTSAPSPRAVSQAAYSPALNETILFGGYDPSYAADGDTWAFAHDRWTELLPSGNPSAPAPRWGGGMVYDASDGYLLLFGGRTVPLSANTSDNTASFFNDTWAYNATGWHRIVTTNAPSPRTYFGLAYDAADGYVLLFGGGVGATWLPWSIYGDTWTYHAGVWTNVTAQLTLAPAPRLVGAMAYDATDGYVLLVAGSDSRDFQTVSCPYVFPDEWAFVGGRWSPVSLESPVEPPGGFGSMWYDAGSHALLYYDGIENLPSDCQAEVGNVWTYATGVWQLAWSVGDGPGPIPRYLTSGLYDQGESQSLLFGGYISWSGPPAFNDTWSLSVIRPTYNLTIGETGLPRGTSWSLQLKNDTRALDPTLSTTSPAPIVIRATDGSYRYEVAAVTGYGPRVSVGSIEVHGPGASLVVSFVPISVPPPPTGPSGAVPAVSWSSVAEGSAVGALGVGLILAAIERRAREKREALHLVQQMRSLRRKP